MRTHKGQTCKRVWTTTKSNDPRNTNIFPNKNEPNPISHITSHQTSSSGQCWKQNQKEKQKKATKQNTRKHTSHTKIAFKKCRCFELNLKHIRIQWELILFVLPHIHEIVDTWMSQLTHKYRWYTLCFVNFYYRFFFEGSFVLSIPTSFWCECQTKLQWKIMFKPFIRIRYPFILLHVQIVHDNRFMCVCMICLPRCRKKKMCAYG